MEANKSLRFLTASMFGILSVLQVFMVLKTYNYIWSISCLVSYLLMTLALLINRPLLAITSCICALIYPIIEMIRYIQYLDGRIIMIQSLVGYNMLTTLFLITCWILLLIGFIKPHLMKILGLASGFFGLAYIAMDYIFHFHYTNGLAPIMIFINVLMVVGIFMIGTFYSYYKEEE